MDYRKRREELIALLPTLKKKQDIAKVQKQLRDAEEHVANELIREILLDPDWSRARLSQELSITTTRIQNWMRPERKVPHKYFQALLKIHEIIGSM